MHIKKNQRNIYFTLFTNMDSWQSNNSIVTAYIPINPLDTITLIKKCRGMCNEEVLTRYFHVMLKGMSVSLRYMLAKYGHI
jgi:hypothetical protein